MLDKSKEERYRDWLYETEKKIVLPAKTIVLLVSFGMLYFLNREFFFSPWCLGFFLFLFLFRPFRIGYRAYKGLFYRHYLKVSFASFIWDALFLVIVICLTGGVRSPLTLVLYAMVIRGAVSYFPSKRLFFSGMAAIFLCWMLGLFLIEKNFLFLREPILLPQMAFFWILSLASTFAMVALAKEGEALQRMEKKIAAAERKRSEELHAANQQLRASEQQLKSANQQLRASEQQLKAANQQLGAKEQALRASQEELKKKMVDLERFNRLMVDREMEMVKLKGEINSLLEKSGQPKKYKAPEKIKGET